MRAESFKVSYKQGYQVLDKSLLLTDPLMKYLISEGVFWLFSNPANSIMSFHLVDFVSMRLCFLSHANGPLVGRVLDDLKKQLKEAESKAQLKGRGDWDRPPLSRRIKNRIKQAFSRWVAFSLL